MSSFGCFDDGRLVAPRDFDCMWYVPFSCRPCVLLLAFFVTGLLPVRAQSISEQVTRTGQRIACADGEAASYPCENVDLLSHLDLEALGLRSGAAVSDIWGWTDPDTGTEYALVGHTDGATFVDLSVPTDPVVVGELPSHTGPDLHRDIKVYEDHAYIVSEADDHGLQIFDLTKLRSISDPPVDFAETAHYDKFSAAHNLAINQESGFAYAVGITGSQEVSCGAGLHIVDVRIPEEPEFAGCHTDPSTGAQAEGYTHDTQCIVYRGPHTGYQGREVCFSANEDQINIADVTDKDSTVTLSNTTYPQHKYVHQAWLTQDHRYLLVDDEYDEREHESIDRTRTLVFDVTDLKDPTLVTEFSGETPATDHDQYVVGDFSYQANYRAGLRILDVSNPEAPGEVAYFDTVPDRNEPGFEGAWGNYPFYDSGIVVVSSIGEGLFVLDPTEAEYSALVSLTAEPDGEGVFLQWGVSSNVKVNRFEIDHTPPRTQQWRHVVSINAQSSGNRTYEYRVSDLQRGTHRFRVRLATEDGTEYVRIARPVRLLPEKEIEITEIGRNPVRGREQFGVASRTSQALRIRLFDAMGRRVGTLYEGRVVEGSQYLVTIPGHELSSGLYFLNIQGDTGELTWRIVVVH